MTSGLWQRGKADKKPDIRISLPASDLAFHNVSSLSVEGGSGDLATEVGVHHELHCLKEIRRWVHREYYFDLETMVPEKRREWESHVGMSYISRSCLAESSH